jgi:DNA-directed RNA polymerase subunit RPC12/RpoP
MRDVMAKNRAAPAPLDVWPSTYICENCGREFPFEHEADEAAHAEAEAIFGCRGDAPGMAIVCDDCFVELMGFGQPS